MMQPNQKNQNFKVEIIKQLSIDNMISQYLNENNPFNFKRKKQKQTKSFTKNLIYTENNETVKKISSHHKLATVDAVMSEQKKCEKKAHNNFFLTINNLSARKTMDPSKTFLNSKDKTGSERVFRFKHDPKLSKNSTQRKIILRQNTEKKHPNQNKNRQQRQRSQKELIKINKTQPSIKNLPHFFKKPKTNSIFEWKSKKLRDRYLMQKIIGRGLSGVVYRAKDILSQRYVAIKIISVDSIEYEFIKQFEHRNMITYYNSFIEGDKRFLVLEYLPYSLSEVVRKKKLTQQQIKGIFRSIAQGVLYLHSLSCVHRDIKLENILANEDLTQIKFIDFGLCVDTSNMKQNALKQFCGTSSYMSPEIISRKCMDAKKADIWSLGVVLYILAVGRAPFNGRQQFQIFNKITKNKTIFPHEMSSKLKKLLISMLKKNPQERPNIMQILNHSWLNYQ